MTFKSVIVFCFTILIICAGLYHFFDKQLRYKFLVTGDVCIAWDKKEDSLKVVGVNGLVSIPMTKSPEEKMRTQIESELAKELQATMSASHNKVAPQQQMMHMQ